MYRNVLHRSNLFNTQEILQCHIWATSWENLIMTYANNKGADKPARPCSPISAFVCCHDSCYITNSKTLGSYLVAHIRRPVFLWCGSSKISLCGRDWFSPIFNQWSKYCLKGYYLCSAYNLTKFQLLGQTNLLKCLHLISYLHACNSFTNYGTGKLEPCHEKICLCILRHGKTRPTYSATETS